MHQVIVFRGINFIIRELNTTKLFAITPYAK